MMKSALKAQNTVEVTHRLYTIRGDRLFKGVLAVALIAGFGGFRAGTNWDNMAANASQPAAAVQPAQGGEPSK